MTNVSKVPLDSETKQKLFRQFAKLFANASEQRIGAIFIELFTEAEQIMFIKRVGIIILVSQGYSNYKIANLLEVSESTVRDIKSKYLAGNYAHIVRVTASTQFNSKKFWQVMELVVTMGVPRKNSPNRWSFLYK